MNIKPLLLKHMQPLLLFLMVILTRLIPHPPNFTMAISALVYSAWQDKRNNDCYENKQNNTYYIWVLLGLVMSDLVLALGASNCQLGGMPGYHVYLSYLIVVLISKSISTRSGGLLTTGIGQLLTTRSNQLLTVSICSAAFFIFSNLGVWCTSNMYESSAQGLMNCYLMAIPFAGLQLCGDLFYFQIIKSIFKPIMTKHAFKVWEIS